MQIRIVKETELWNVLNFSAQMFWKQDLARYTEEGKEAFLAFLKYEDQLERYRAGQILLFAAFDKDKVCAAMELDTAGEILFLYTDPERVKMNLEEKLLQEACRLAVSSGMYNTLTVKTIPEKEEMYRRLGFDEEAGFLPEHGMMKKVLRISVEKAAAQRKPKKKSNTGLYIGIAVVAGLMFFVLIVGLFAFFIFGSIQRNQSNTGQSYVQETPFEEWDGQEMLPLPGNGDDTDESADEDDGILQAEAYIAPDAGYETEEQNDVFESDQYSSYFVSYNINYPKVSGLSDEVEDKVNQTLKDCARETVVTYYEEPTEEVKEWMMMQQNAVVASQVKYKVTYQDENLLCVAFEDYYAVGNYQNIRVGLRAVVVNVKNGEVYELGDVLETNRAFAKFWKEEAQDNYPESAFVNAYDERELAQFLEGKGTDEIGEESAGESMMVQENVKPVFMLTGEGIEVGFEYLVEDSEIGNGYLTVDFDKEDLKSFQKQAKFWKMVEEM